MSASSGTSGVEREDLESAFAKLGVGCNYPESRFIPVADGRRIHLLDWRGSGQAVLFLHGGALSAHTWTRLCAMLKDSYRCIALDLRGHGDSDWASSYRIEDYVEDTRQVLEILKPIKPHIVGMSLGGVVGCYLTLHQGPTSFSSLTLVDVAPGVDFNATARIREFVDADTVTRGIPALVSAARANGARHRECDLIYRYTALTRYDAENRLRWKQDRRRPINYEHILDRLGLLTQLAGSLNLPVLVARGGRSKILSKQSAKRFSDLCPNGVHRVIEAAGHSIQEDNPKGLAIDLQKFWTKVPDKG